MSKDHVFHPESINGLKTNHLFNNPFFPSHDKPGQMRDDIYRVLSANRICTDEERDCYREALNQNFEVLYPDILTRERARATFIHQGAMLGIQAWSGSVLLHARTPHHRMHRVEIVDRLVSVVPYASIEIDGIHEPVNGHEAWSLAVGIAGIAAVILQRGLDVQVANADHASSRQSAIPVSHDLA